MADLYNSDLGGNTRKVQPTSLLGTRKLKFFSIWFDYNMYTDDGAVNFPARGYTNPGSLYWYVVKCLQEVGEIYMLGAPTTLDTQEFVFAIADETAEWYYSEYGVHDETQSGEDLTDNTYPQRYLPGGFSGINDMADRLVAEFGNGWWELNEVEDCGFGLMFGQPLYN